MSIQMICPYCKKEFPFNNGNLDREIEEAKQKLKKIEEELVCIKCLPYSLQKQREGRRKVLISEKSKVITKLSKLKAVRKVANENMRRTENGIFRQIVRERYGKEEYEKIIALVEEEMKAYSVCTLMKHEYSRSNSKSSVTRLNKI